MSIILRYRNQDKYDHPVFTCRADSDAEKDSFKKMFVMFDKINTLNYGTHNPIYYNEQYQYINIAFRKIQPDVFDMFSLKTNTLYKVDLSVHSKEIKEKKHINVYVDKLVVIGEAKEERGAKLVL